MTNSAKDNAPIKIPEHIAIIMDGNGRWAQKRNLPRTAGHSVGAETFRKVARYCKSIGVKYLTVYAFSTENWKRPQSEINAIMGLLETYLKEALEKMEKEGIKLKILGDLSALSPKIRALIEKTEEKNKRVSGCQANLCVNYGGRADIIRALKSLRDSGEEITERAVSDRLYTAGMPDPDLIIRPGGEKRISNFLLWQCAYSEFYFTDTLWPDFDENEIMRAIESYSGRERRYGGVL